MSKNNDVVTDKVMEGEVVEEVSIDEEIERLEALVKAESSANSDKKRKKRNIFIGAGVGVLGLLGGMYLMGKKAEKDREKEEAGAADGSGYVLYDSTGAALPNNGMFTADGSTTTF